MQTTIFYVFEPTAALRELAAAAGQEYMAEPAVWLVRERDRVGAEYSGDELSKAHWLQFVANLVGEKDEPATLVEFREKCLALGFVGCWTLIGTKAGGEAKDLMEEGRSAEKFLAKCGLSPS
jgi:hypothetical protein